MKRFFLTSILALGLLVGFAPLSGNALAKTPTPAPAPKTTPAADQCIQLSIPVLASGNNGGCGPNAIPNNQPGGAIVYYLKQILKLLSLAIGAVIMLVMVVAGIQYITSTGDPVQIKAAKTRIINAITALILFLMTYAIINFLIPGGLFS